ncbi:MAG: hypothetical protein Q4D13_05330, partial [Erysipelotrichaceae bacterium]|nr:hypothetical protein [Erysipelotrichaceae bacterium]
MELFGFSHFLILIEIPVVIVTAYLLHKHLNYEKTVVTVSFVLFVLEIFKQIYLYILKGTVSLWD